MEAWTAAILFFLFISRRAAAIGQCARASSQPSYRFLSNRVAPDRKTADLNACFDLCRKTTGCGSANYNLKEGVCELNSKNHLTHPKDFEEKDGYIYLPLLDVVKETTAASNSSQEQPKPPWPEAKYRTCAQLKEKKPSSPSGVYELAVNGLPKAVYCDMDNFGGGWALVVSISGSDMQHLLRTENNCFNSTMCVPLASGTLVARKNSDSDIQALASHEGTFRIDVTSTSSTTLYYNFYRLAQGPQVFDSGCAGSGCPRIILSHVYPYVWESNCFGIEKGYQIYRSSCYKVFDGHDNGVECGGTWRSSKYFTERVLYNHCSYNGIFSRLQGNMYVR